MSIEAMKQALEALEINLVFLRNVKPFKGQEDLASDCVAMTDETITSLRQAIDAAEQHTEAEKHSATHGEPVAWMRPSEEGYDSAFRDHRTLVACTGNKWEGWVPLYTHPQPKAEQEEAPRMIIDASAPIVLHPHPAFAKQEPKREWVGLTQNQINSICEMSEIAAAVVATELLLKEKNT